MAVFGISVKGNPEQQELVRLIQENNKPIVLVEGPAGTGKSFISIATALELKENKKYNKIIYIRDAVQVGHDIGHLPGDVDDKMAPFWGPVKDSLEAIVHNSTNKYNIKDLEYKIEVIPLAFVRGRSFCNSIIIVDEVESMDLNAIKTILTRADKWSKIILLGSYKQIDDWRIRAKAKSDFQLVVERLQQEPFVGFVQLKKSMRSEWCVLVDEILDEIKN